MCKQMYTLYTCGCKPKGEFVQCDAKYNAQSNLQCARTETGINESRNYCSEHLVKDNKATMKYTKRVDK